MKTLKIGPWIKDRILLIDLGFYNHQIFARIEENGGYFVSRLKGNAGQLIVSTNRTWRGRTTDVVRIKLSEVLPKLKRHVLDVEVEFNRRKHKGNQRKDTKRFRLVAVYNAEENKYHMYLTNISADYLVAEEYKRSYIRRDGR